jgi:hypothetical protein
MQSERDNDKSGLRPVGDWVGAHRRRSATDDTTRDSDVWLPLLRAVTATFELFRRTYGSVWVAHIEATGMGPQKAALHWAKQLQDATAQEIEQAASQWSEDMPPNVMALRKRILAKRVEGKPATAAHRPYQALPQPRSDRTAALKALAQCKATLPQAAAPKPERQEASADEPQRAQRRREIVEQLRELGVALDAGP